MIPTIYTIKQTVKAFNQKPIPAARPFFSFKSRSFPSGSGRSSSCSPSSSFPLLPLFVSLRLVPKKEGSGVPGKLRINSHSGHNYEKRQTKKTPVAIPLTKKGNRVRNTMSQECTKDWWLPSSSIRTFTSSIPMDKTKTR